VPTIERWKGYRFFFFSNERKEPAHVHVEQAERYAKFWLNPVELADSADFNSSELTRLRKLVEEKRETFLERWNEYHNR